MITMEDETTQNVVPVNTGTVFNILIYSPLYLYALLDLDPTPYGWSFEFLSFALLSTVASTMIATRYDLDVTTNIRGENKSRRSTRLLGGGLLLGGLFFSLGWVSVWLDQGYSVTVIAQSLLYQEMLPIDFVIGILLCIFGVPIILRSYLGKTENLWQPGDD